ncbi:hypothetical protein F8388_015627 [Cannabis sativa]|uniref:RNase H type-1 domain-containing protein n=1 Tax=Cannabis sativa TaxID=3483 RepID=A0A7J6HIC1_CANSA|nr:hypothetical protein F8388_015627 [Cannabis sativa]
MVKKSILQELEGNIIDRLYQTYSSELYGGDKRKGAEKPLLPLDKAGEHEEKEKSKPVSYSYSFFHLIFSLASMYSAMLLTGWSTSVGASGKLVDVGWPSVWIRIITVFVWFFTVVRGLVERAFMMAAEYGFEDLGGHTDQYCSRLFIQPIASIVKPYGSFMKAVPQRTQYAMGSKWLRSASGGAGNFGASASGGVGSSGTSRHVQQGGEVFQPRGDRRLNAHDFRSEPQREIPQMEGQRLMHGNRDVVGGHARFMGISAVNSDVIDGGDILGSNGFNEVAAHCDIDEEGMIFLETKRKRDVELICKIPLPALPEIDTWYWSFEKFGGYSRGLGLVFNNGEEDFGAWFEGFCNSHLTENIEKLAMILWSVWGARNDLVWNDKAISVERVVSSAITHLELWKFAQSINGGASSSSGQPRADVEHWIKPSLGELKVNCDAALFLGERSHGLGWIARDHAGLCVAAAAVKHRGDIDPVVAEALSMKEALIYKLSIESYAK